MTTIIDKIRKRIMLWQIIEGKTIQEIEVTKEEVEELRRQERNR